MDSLLPEWDSHRRHSVMDPLIFINRRMFYIFINKQVGGKELSEAGQ